MTTVTGAVYSHKGILSTRTYHPRSHVSFSDVQASYGLHFKRVMRMPADAFYDLVDRLRPRLPRRSVPPEVRTAIALRYLGGGSYLDFCATLGVHIVNVKKMAVAERREAEPTTQHINEVALAVRQATIKLLTGSSRQ